MNIANCQPFAVRILSEFQARSGSAVWDLLLGYKFIRPTSMWKLLDYRVTGKLMPCRSENLDLRRDLDRVLPCLLSSQLNAINRPAHCDTLRLSRVLSCPSCPNFVNALLVGNKRRLKPFLLDITARNIDLEHRPATIMLYFFLLKLSPNLSLLLVLKHSEFIRGAHFLIRVYANSNVTFGPGNK